MKPGDRVTVEFPEDEGTRYAGTVRTVAGLIRVELDEDPPIVTGWSRSRARTWWLAPEQVTPNGNN